MFIKRTLQFVSRKRQTTSLSMSLFTVENPFFQSWEHLPFGIPPFQDISYNHYEPAFLKAFEDHKNEIKAIASQSDEPDFKNTIESFDRSGKLLDKVACVFDNLCSSDCPPELQKVQLQMAGPLASHSSSIYMYPGLFDRVDQVYQNRNSQNLNSEQIRLVERFHLDFVRAGAKFDEDAKVKYASIVEKLAELTTKFVQNVLGDESNFTIPLNADDDFLGLPDYLVDGAKQAAEERRESGVTDKAVITLSRSLVEPFLTFSARRDLREKAW